VSTNSATNLHNIIQITFQNIKFATIINKVKAKKCFLSMEFGRSSNICTRFASREAGCNESRQRLEV
jgi:hypothetical protein